MRAGPGQPPALSGAAWPGDRAQARRDAAAARSWLSRCGPPKNIDDKMKLQLATLFAKDMNRMTVFYRDGLGLTIVPEKSSEGCVVFDAGGTFFALHAIPPAIARQIHIAEPPDERSETPIKLVFQTAEMDAVCTRLGAGIPRHRSA
jgi:hypothetical protein